MGQSVKNRRRKVSKATRKPPKHPKLRVVKNLKNSHVKKFYDSAKSPAANLESMGLTPNPNKIKADKKIDENFPGFMGYVDDLTEAAKENPKPRSTLNEMDVKYVEDLLAKHGENYKAMERDIKTNYNQHTEAQLKKLVKKYHESQSSNSEAEN
jgi:nucleolar protein 16